MQPLDPLPVLLDYSEEEKRICQLQNGFADRLRKSACYVVEPVKSNGQNSCSTVMARADLISELERYSDKYRRSTVSQPTLKRSELHAPFFPSEIFEGYFNPRKKLKSVHLVAVILCYADAVDVSSGKETQICSLESRRLARRCRRAGKLLCAVI